MSDASPPAAATPAFQSSPVNSKQCAAPGRTACPRRGRPLSPPTPRPRRLRAPRRPQVQPDHDAQGGALCARDGPAVAAAPQGTAPARPAAAPRAPAPRRPPSTPVTGPCSASCPLLGRSICTSRATATRSAACAATRAASSTSPGAAAGQRARCEVNACALPCASARGGRTALARSLTRATLRPAASQRTPIRPPPPRRRRRPRSPTSPTPSTSETPTGPRGPSRAAERRGACAPRLQPRSRFEVHSPKRTRRREPVQRDVSIRRRRTNRSVFLIALVAFATGLL